MQGKCMKTACNLLPFASNPRRIAAFFGLLRRVSTSATIA